jgi:hypothetical protein
LSNWQKRWRPKEHSPGKARDEVVLFRDWVQSWKSAHNFGVNGQGGNFQPDERERALIEKKQVEIERDRFKLDAKRREYVKRTEVNEELSRCCALVRRELYKAFEHDLPPRVEGLSALEIKKHNRKRLDEILRGLPKTFENNGA